MNVSQIGVINWFVSLKKSFLVKGKKKHFIDIHRIGLKIKNQPTLINSH